MTATLVVRLALVASDILVLIVTWRATAGLWGLRNVAVSTNKMSMAGMVFINGMVVNCSLRKAIDVPLQAPSTSCRSVPWISDVKHAQPTTNRALGILNIVAIILWFTGVRLIAAMTMMFYKACSLRQTFYFTNFFADMFVSILSPIPFLNDAPSQLHGNSTV